MPKNYKNKKSKKGQKKGKGRSSVKISTHTYNSVPTLKALSSIPLPPSLPDTILNTLVSDKTYKPLTSLSLTLKSKTLTKKKTLKKKFEKENMKRILQSIPKYRLSFPNESTHATIKDEKFISYLKELFPTISEPRTWYT